ncbi:hypothetical protein [Alicyclobacillus ferrooxydans]|uniref:Uncharacterized protein n=1 Tax=Alicyclobacillus ferrooxydans TaxID=471514 RepID=A0A0P9CU39_9BACL|nr:hypothetical protein [Alicyclobacillus ferrooxydans]KPV43187.1 hypothetical protein AN477_13960 [Alicyclobacillus ferrooxydans]
MLPIDYVLAHAGLGYKDEWETQYSNYVKEDGTLVVSGQVWLFSRYEPLDYASVQVIRDGQLINVFWSQSVAEHICGDVYGEREGWVPDFWGLDILTAFYRLLDELELLENGSPVLDLDRVIEVEEIPTLSAWQA